MEHNSPADPALPDLNTRGQMLENFSGLASISLARGKVPPLPIFLHIQFIFVGPYPPNLSFSLGRVFSIRTPPPSTHEPTVHWSVFVSLQIRFFFGFFYASALGDPFSLLFPFFPFCLFDYSPYITLFWHETIVLAGCFFTRASV